MSAIAPAADAFWRDVVVEYRVDGAGPFTYGEVVALRPARSEAEWQRWERLETAARVAGR